MSGLYRSTPEAIVVSPSEANLATITSKNSSASSATLLAANPSRRGVIIHNTDEYTLYVKYGATATTATGGYTVAIGGGGTWVMDDPLYLGILDGIWNADGSGGASITELT